MSSNDREEDGPAIRVLVVDDSPEVRAGLCSVLRLAGRATRPQLEVAGTAENGRQALERAEALRPEVILMDLEMPELDGFAATRLIRQALSAARIVVLTIHAGAEARRKAAQAGADAFLEKGGSLEEMLETIGCFPAAGQNSKLE